MIGERTRFNSGFDRYQYYNELLMDYIKVEIPKETKWCNKKKNVELYNEAVKAKVLMTQYRKTYFIVLKFIVALYGKGNDFGRILKIYQGFKAQTGILVVLVSHLRKIEIPADYYIQAIKYTINKFVERKNYLNLILEEYIAMTPLQEYLKTLPEGVDLFDDIWENIDFKDDLDENNRQANDYMEKVMSSININSISEAREKYLELMNARHEKITQEKNAIKEAELKRKREMADEFTAVYAKDFYKRYMGTKKLSENCRTRIYKNSLKVDNPKIFVLASVRYSNINGKRPVPKFLGENGKIEAGISNAKVFNDDDPIPAEMEELYNNYKYGYSELILEL